MTGSPSSIIMLGLGNGTFAGSPSLLVTLGYGIGAATNGITDRWANVIHVSVDSTRTIARIDHQRSEVTVDQGRLG